MIKYDKVKYPQNQHGGCMMAGMVYFPDPKPNEKQRHFINHLKERHSVAYYPDSRAWIFKGNNGRIIVSCSVINQFDFEWIHQLAHIIETMCLERLRKKPVMVRGLSIPYRTISPDLRKSTRYEKFLEISRKDDFERDFEVRYRASD